MEILRTNQRLTRRFGSDIALIIHLYVEHIVGFNEDITQCKKTIHICRDMIQHILTAKYTAKLHKLLLDDVGYEFRELIQNVKYTAIQHTHLHSIIKCNMYNLHLCTFEDDQRSYCRIGYNTHAILDADSICHEDYLKIFKEYKQTAMQAPYDFNAFIKIIKAIINHLLSLKYKNMFCMKELTNAHESFCDDDLCHKFLCHM